MVIMEDKSNKSVVEFLGMCGKHVTVDMNHVEYIQEAKAMDKSCTLICFSSGKKMFVDAEYALVRDLLSIFRTGNTSVAFYTRCD